ncbi:YhfC family intramembrane metalloprotease [Ktedonosporobacter rubrisoli]|uniref:YhfC family intramembrane metalloprotease n=1 Tax=Ktedonosporobacter rubrisoli TaxID=2509675 RepID=A0A4P6JX60_KTERU|nr:YhfC family glutamic-type intramembrane protease [Ktedonosporobacter rubrisoli]QBD79983.1 YhfC family intramembrane metalloprotease [Ktedonosporobacter rubrisoli]
MTLLNWGAFAVAMALMVLFPLGLAAFFQRRFSLSWKMFFIAAGFYLLNLLIQIPFNFVLWPMLFGSMPWVLLAFITLTYGVCEETMRYLSFRVGRSMRDHRDANGALMAGVGHGGTEAIVFALQLAMAIVAAVFAPQFLRPGTHPAEILGAAAWSFVFQGLDRVIGITCHLGFATLIVLAYRRSWLFYPLAALVHWLIDFSAFGLQRLPGGQVWSELLFLGYAILALVLLRYVRTRHLADPAPSLSTDDEKQASATA